MTSSCKPISPVENSIAYRNRPFRKAALSGLIVLVLLAGCDSEQAQDPVRPELIEKSAALADAFQSELQAQLSQALSTVGPVGAIDVCQQVAPIIAEDLSRESGGRVSRIALRNRNAGNAVRADVADLYNQLAAQPLIGGKPAAVHRTTRDGAVYLRAIPMRAKPCAACHGTNISPDVAAAIAQAYPGDKATGFSAGELRGAFLIEWPIADEDAG